MRTIVIFSGAGLSKESGIPTFRDSKDGLWENYKVEDVADHKAWGKNKDVVLRFYEDRFHNIKSCNPNVAHEAIASLQEKYKVINVTQNIDDLLERAGSKDIWHLHGSITSRKCEKHSNITNLDGDINFTCNYVAEHDTPVKAGDKCTKCGSHMRPNVVWFGEAVDMKIKELRQIIDDAYIFIGVGTSAQVSPAADLVWMSRHIPLKFWVDPEPPIRLKSFGILKGKATEKVPELTKFLLGLN